MIYSTKAKIPASWTDGNAKLRLISALDILQNAEWFAAVAYGDFENYFREHNCAMFLVSRYCEITKLPRLNEEITVNSMPYFHNAMFGHRYAEIVDINGNVCIATWVVAIYVNTLTGKPMRVPLELAPQPMPVPPKIPENTRKIEILGDKISTTTYTVRRNDIDKNKHMNNIRYIEVAYEALPNIFE